MIADKKIQLSNRLYNIPENRLYRIHNLLIFLILTGIAMAFIITSPATAGEQYMAGSPERSAAIARTNELSSDNEVPLAVAIQNTGVNQFKFVKTGIVDRDDLPNTAKFLTVTPVAGNTPLIIKSDPLGGGGLNASGTKTAGITVREAS
jgi:hypothetical protein